MGRSILYQLWVIYTDHPERQIRNQRLGTQLLASNGVPLGPKSWFPKQWVPTCLSGWSGQRGKIKADDMLFPKSAAVAEASKFLRTGGLTFFSKIFF